VSSSNRAVEAGSSQPWYLSATPLAALPWLIRLRWATVLIDLVVLVTAVTLPYVDFPLRRIALLIASAALANAALALFLSRRRSVPRSAAVVTIAVDVLLLTGLLELTGGPFNPFAVIYAVHVALAAVTLGRVYTVPIFLLAIAGYGVLLYWHTIEGATGHHRINDFPTHLFTMWVATVAVAELAAYFMVQASTAVEAMRVRAARSERLASLTTLAAGAAHELSTPLATIAVVARELEHAAGGGASNLALIEDARLIRTEVDRCQAILDQMSGRAGGSGADMPEPLDIRTAIADVVQELSHERRARVEPHISPDVSIVRVSRLGFRRALLSLLDNALEASAGSEPVTLTAAEAPDGLGIRISVHDRGAGIPPELLARAGEPFVTTKDAGRGLGLGLFLARVFAERSGGSLSIQSGDGTTVTLDLPLESEGVRVT
jgi:two-component system sensor histidine kinase RegB